MDILQIAKETKKKLSFLGMYISRDKYERVKNTEEILALTTKRIMRKVLHQQNKMQDALDKETEELDDIYQEKINVNILRAKQRFNEEAKKKYEKIYEMM